MVTVFVYGSLMSEAVMYAACGARAMWFHAHLPGYCRRAICGERFPGITRKDGAVVRGRLYTGLRPAALKRLDRFEGNWYQRATVTVCCDVLGSVDAQVYVIRPAHRFRLADQDWDFERFLRRDESSFLARIRAGQRY